MTYRCRLHEQEPLFDQIPVDAVELGTASGRGRTRGHLLRFVDGTIHNLFADRSTKAVHTRFHKTLKHGCQYCQTKILSGDNTTLEGKCGKPDIASTAEAPQGMGDNVGQPADLPTPEPEPEVEDDENAVATMAHAFRNRR
jgi:hypothetical protein